MTREEFQRLYDQGPEAVFALLEQQTTLLTALTQRVQELEARLNKDSHNSHKPPSSDGLSKKPVNLRQKSGKKPGAQGGHPGHTLSQVQKPDATLPHSPPACSGCGASLWEVEATCTERRQVFDLPPLRLFVTEHQRLSKVCPHCQTPNAGSFPSEVSQPVQYGERLQGLCVYLTQYQLLPFARTQELLADLFGASLCEGTLAHLLAHSHQTLAPVETAIKEALTGADILHNDETGVRIAGGLQWLHSSSSARLTFYASHPKRGRGAMEEIGILPAFRGRSVHDAWAPYFTYSCSHALCNAHLVRELIGIYEQTKQSWSWRMKALLLSLKRDVDRYRQAGADHLPPERLERYEKRYARLIAQGRADNPLLPATGKRGPAKQSTARNLLERLDTYRACVLAFAHDFTVPFDNNLAERDLRMVKVRQKISGCFRSVEGAAQFCRIRGYISTMRKQGYNLMEAIRSVCARQPIMPQLDP